MIYYSILIYCFTGISVALVIYLLNKNTNEDETDVLDFLSKEDSIISWQDFILEKILVPFFGITFVIIAWPFLLYLQFKEKHNNYEEPKVFSVKKTDLVKKISVTEIEKKEMVFDPLKAVPNIPFGHLNGVWINFKNKILKDDEIWAFSVIWEDEWDYKEKRSGYTIVRDNEPQDYIILSFD